MLSTGEQEVRISVPEGKIGAVIGKGGEIITSLKTLVGVRIRISERDMFIPGTRDREVSPYRQDLDKSQLAAAKKFFPRII